MLGYKLSTHHVNTKVTTVILNFKNSWTTSFNIAKANAIFCQVPYNWLYRVSHPLMCLWVSWSPRGKNQTHWSYVCLFITHIIFNSKDFTHQCLEANHTNKKDNSLYYEYNWSILKFTQWAIHQQYSLPNRWTQLSEIQVIYINEKSSKFQPCWQFLQTH